MRSPIVFDHDPVGRALARAPIDDELLTPEEEAAIALACAELERGEGIPADVIMAEFGLTPTLDAMIEGAWAVALVALYLAFFLAAMGLLLGV